MGAAKPEGTRRINAGGYVQVKVNGQRRWSFEHRLVWEKEHGPIPIGGVIHHINHIKTDNRLKNLELVAKNGIHLGHNHRDEMIELGQRVGKLGKGVPKSPEHRNNIKNALLRFHRGS